MRRVRFPACLEPGVDVGEELAHLRVAEGEGLVRLVLDDDG